MKRIRILLVTIFISISLFSYAQEFLNIEENKECEIFPDKGKFNYEERLEEIKNLDGTEVTVFLIKPKSGKIKNKFIGNVYNDLIDVSKLSIETETKVMTIKSTDANGNQSFYFPLTYSVKYRIYLTECLLNK